MEKGRRKLTTIGCSRFQLMERDISRRNRLPSDNGLSASKKGLVNRKGGRGEGPEGLPDITVGADEVAWLGRGTPAAGGHTPRFHPEPPLFPSARSQP